MRIFALPIFAFPILNLAHTRPGLFHTFIPGADHGPRRQEILSRQVVQAFVRQDPPGAGCQKAAARRPTGKVEVVMATVAAEIRAARADSCKRSSINPPAAGSPDREPGNNPFTDILHYGHSEFGEPVDGCVKGLASMPGFDAVAGEITEILWNHLPLGQTKGKERLTRMALLRLNEIKQRLQRRT